MCHIVDIFLCPSVLSSASIRDVVVLQPSFQNIPSKHPRGRDMCMYKNFFYVKNAIPKMLCIFIRKLACVLQYKELFMVYFD